MKKKIAITYRKRGELETKTNWLLGGMWWNKAHDQKATASNAGPVIGALLLYSYTNQRVYLSYAVKVYDYWLTNMVDPNTYQVCDHLLPSGEKVWWVYTYNQGLMLGATMKMYQLFQDPKYLTTMSGLYRFLQTETVDAPPYEHVLFDQDCTGDCDEMKGITFRYLAEYYQLQLQLGNQAEAADIYNFLKNNMLSIWNLARNYETGLISVNWQGPVIANGKLCNQTEQNSGTMALNLFAALPTPPSAIANDI